MIAKKSYLFIIAIAVAFIAILWAVKVVLFFLFLLFVFTIYYFRNTKVLPRKYGDEYIISPCDGILKKIEDEVIDGVDYKKLTVKLDVISTRVLKMPFHGVIKSIDTQPLISNKVDSLKGEVQTIEIEGENQCNLKLKHYGYIYGVSCINYVRTGDDLSLGDGIALLRFGSKVEVFIPSDYNIDAPLEEMIHTGKTVMATKNI